MSIKQEVLTCTAGMTGCTRFGEHGANGSSESVLALSGVVDCEVLGNFFQIIVNLRDIYVR